MEKERGREVWKLIFYFRYTGEAWLKWQVIQIISLENLTDLVSYLLSTPR